MEVGLYEGGSRNPEEVENGESRAKESAANKALNCEVVMDLNSESPKEDKICRICHFGSGDSSGPGSELVPLGCDCRGELGLSHHNCAGHGFRRRETGGSRNPEEVENGESRAKERAANNALNYEVVMDLNSESPKEDKVCRICHFGSGDSSGPGSELVPLGCDCRGELGLSHHNCAEAWFSQKGNRLCEICGKTARNIVVNDDEDVLVFMIEWNEMRLAQATLDGYDESNRARRCKKSLYKVVLSCLVLAFIIPWFFRY